MSAAQRLGFGFLGAPAVPEMVTFARRAEELGYESVWIAETRFTRDGIAPAAAIAQATSTIKVATGIVNVYTRGPVLTAISFASLDEISQGRTIMGLGAGSPLVLAPQGVSFDKPLTRLREYADVVQRLLAGEAVTFKGETIDLRNVQLELKPVRAHIPLYLGVTGRRALALCGEIADGVMMNAFLPTSYTRRAIKQIEAGAIRAGRTLAAFDTTGALVVSVADDSKTGKERVRPLIALYLSVFPNIARETELDGDFILRVRQTFNAQGMDAAGKLIADEVVDALTVAGTVAECKARLAQYREAGLQMPILFPVESNIRMALETLYP